MLVPRFYCLVCDLVMMRLATLLGIRPVLKNPFFNGFLAQFSRTPSVGPNTLTYERSKRKMCLKAVKERFPNPNSVALVLVEYYYPIRN